MMDLFQKLMMMKQLQFKEGEIKLLNQRVMIIPQEIIIAPTNFLIQNKNYIPVFYEMLRTSFTKGWAEGVKKFYNFKQRAYFNFLIDVAALSGWGKSELVKFNFEGKTGVFRTYNNPVGEFFKGKVSEPVDHFWRGLTSGAITQMYDEDIDWIETNCIATGAPYCEFLFAPRTKIKELAGKLKYQLPD